MNKTVIILAGGSGSRVKEVYPDLIKPLFPVNGIPIIERQIKMFGDYTIFINCNEEDKEKLEYLHLPLLVERGVRIGNAGALVQFRKELGEKFFIIHCDILTDLNPDNLWEAHKGYMTMVVKNIRKEKEFGLCTLKDGKILDCTKDRYVNTGIYTCTKDIFNYIDGNRFQDLDKDLFPKLIKENQLYYYDHSGCWMDIGTSDIIEHIKNDTTKP